MGSPPRVARKLGGTISLGESFETATNKWANPKSHDSQRSKSHAGDHKRPGSKRKAASKPQKPRNHVQQIAGPTKPNPECIMLPFPKRVLHPTRIAAVPWGKHWPELVDYYMHHQPDFTGLNARVTPSMLPAEYEQLAMTSPHSITTQIIIAEAARESDRLPQPKIDWLAGQAITLINESLRIPALAISNSAIGSISALVLYDTMFGNLDAARIHRNGLASIVRLRGGITALESAVVLRNLVLWCDSFFAWRDASAELFARERELCAQSVHPGPLSSGKPVGISLGAGHPIRQALLPTRSNLSSYRILNQLMIQAGGPEQSICSCLNATRYLHDLIYYYPAEIGPEQGNAYLQAIEERLLNDSGLLYHRLPSSSIFSEEDQDNFRDILEMCRRCNLFLLACLRSRLEWGLVSGKRVDHGLEYLNLLNFDKIVERHPMLGCWALCVSTIFATGFVRTNKIKNIRKVAKRLHVSTFDSLTKVLAGTLYCQGLFEAPLFHLWADLDKKG